MSPWLLQTVHTNPSSDFNLVLQRRHTLLLNSRQTHTVLLAAVRAAIVSLLANVQTLTCFASHCMPAA